MLCVLAGSSFALLINPTGKITRAISTADCPGALRIGTVNCGGTASYNDIVGTPYIKWYKVSIASSGKMKATLTGSGFDADLYLYEACNQGYKKRSELYGTNETIEYDVTGGKVYYLGVVGYTGAGRFDIKASLACGSSGGSGGGSSGGSSGSSNCHAAPLWSMIYCTSSCPCDAGQGDCDYDSDCKGSLVCKQNVGAKYGQSSGMDVCEANTPSCSSDCASGQKRCSGSYLQTCGNYDSDSCYEWPSSTSGSGNSYCSNGCSGSQCSLPPAPTGCHTYPLWYGEYCTSSCPCDAGEGDCDVDVDCKPGLKCVYDVGAKYGQASSMDVCEGTPTGNGDTSVGWKCKNTAYLGYKKGDGSWTNLIKCKHGCQNDTCYVSEQFCSQYGSTTQPSTGVITQPQWHYVFYPAVAEFVAYLPAAFVALVGVTLVTFESNQWTYFDWPTSRTWTSQENLNTHWDDHGHEFPYLTKGKYADECIRQMNSKINERYEDSDGTLISYNATTRMFVRANTLGEIIACHIANRDYIDRNLSNRFKPIPYIPPICMVI